MLTVVFLSLMLEVKPDRVLCILGKLSNNELHPKSVTFFKSFFFFLYSVRLRRYSNVPRIFPNGYWEFLLLLFTSILIK